MMIDEDTGQTGQTLHAGRIGFAKEDGVAAGLPFTNWPHPHPCTLQ